MSYGHDGTGSREMIIIRSKGSPYKYVKASKEWVRTGEHCAIMILHDKERNSHRIAAVTEDNKVPLDCALFTGLEHELRRAFLQWKDGNRILGVKFGDESVAARFAARLASVVASIGTVPTSTGGSLRAPVGGAAGALPGAPASAFMGPGNGAILVPRLMSSRQLFQRVESMAIPASHACCVCGQLHNDLLLKPVSDQGVIEGGGEPLRLPTTSKTGRKLCTKCWVRNLKQAAGLPE